MAQKQSVPDLEARICPGAPLPNAAKMPRCDGEFDFAENDQELRA